MFMVKQSWYMSKLVNNLSIEKTTAYTTTTSLIIIVSINSTILDSQSI